jgi:hypothetical protein
MAHAALTQLVLQLSIRTTTQPLYTIFTARFDTHFSKATIEDDPALTGAVGGLAVA